MTSFRRFETEADPFGRKWIVEFKWQQNAITIRHADAVDCKFVVSDGEEWLEKVISLRHPDLLRLSHEADRSVTDAWVMKLAGLHVKHMIETGEDLEKTLVTADYADLKRHNEALESAVRSAAGR